GYRILRSGRGACPRLFVDRIPLGSFEPRPHTDLSGSGDSPVTRAWAAVFAFAVVLPGCALGGPLHPPSEAGSRRAGPPQSEPRSSLSTRVGCFVQKRPL